MPRLSLCKHNIYSDIINVKTLTIQMFEHLVESNLDEYGIVYRESRQYTEHIRYLDQMEKELQDLKVKCN